jgi:hypothetical protein
LPEQVIPLMQAKKESTEIPASNEALKSYLESFA